MKLKLRNGTRGGLAASPYLYYHGGSGEPGCLTCVSQSRRLLLFSYICRYAHINVPQNDEPVLEQGSKRGPRNVHSILPVEHYEKAVVAEKYIHHADTEFATAGVVLVVVLSPISVLFTSRQDVVVYTCLYCYGRRLPLLLRKREHLHWLIQTQLPATINHYPVQCRRSAESISCI